MKKKSIFALVNYAMPLMALAFACASCGEKGSGPGPDPDPGEGGDGDVEVPSTPSYNFQGEAYITKVLDFMPAPGQFTNTLPAYAEGDDQEAMNQKVLNAIGNNKRGMISLGGFGGYVIVGFDHTIENKAGLRDFRVLGNAYKNSSEPGVIMVALDRNQNGQPDDDEWYEIAGSAHQKAFQESWYAAARENGNDVDIHRNYEITYFRPSQEPTTQEEKETYIRWEDNLGQAGYLPKNAYHSQPYFPQWFEGDRMTIKGTCLPQNSIPNGAIFELQAFTYGYADNVANTDVEASIDIDWAVDASGEKVSLPGIDFVKIYTAVNQVNGWIGECSSEITGVEDLHMLEEKIPTR